MTRAEMKKQLGLFRPSLLRPEMIYKTLSERKLMRMEERAWIRYEREKLAIYKNRALTDDQRSVLWRKARDRRWAVEDRLRPLRQSCDRIGERRMIKLLASSKMRPDTFARRRAAA